LPFNVIHELKCIKHSLQFYITLIRYTLRHHLTSGSQTSNTVVGPYVLPCNDLKDKTAWPHELYESKLLH